MGFSIINHLFWGTPIHGDPHLRSLEDTVHGCEILHQLVVYPTIYRFQPSAVGLFENSGKTHSLHCFNIYFPTETATAGVRISHFRHPHIFLCILYVCIYIYIYIYDGVYIYIYMYIYIHMYPRKFQYSQQNRRVSQ